MIREIYHLDPIRRRINFVYRPSHRKDAVVNRDYGEVYMGLSGSRARPVPLSIKSAHGKPYFYIPTQLLFTIDLEGSLKVEFRPFHSGVDRGSKVLLLRALRNHLSKYAPFLARHHIVHDSAWASINLSDALTIDVVEEYGLCFYSPTYYFPLTFERGLREIQKAFVALYPLFDATLCAARGERHELPAMLRCLEAWYEHEEEEGEIEERSDEINLPELASYQFVRAGLWWDILARDQWQCRSCGRTARGDGIVLHVDHILPRSRGGSDCPDNLQTLCHKCNIGKSNRDSTDLRAFNERPPTG